MPFRESRYQGVFKPDDLQILQAAYDRCCLLLDRRPTTDEDSDKLARTIIRAFQSGQHAPERIAEIVTRPELSPQLEHRSDPIGSKRALEQP
ncbi:hypothetical protein DKP76_06340 [Falsochrobactrum shanghaiense]|uniref:Uncharacterized protein n=1 Tax=Falsochrobactrum shanghaiense TaxID=2201899 RepID=A0A316JB62_9HYPH|nr:hypothetical protein [Falsochrobactrum shanghaiense]PWL18694.1 hypothetical protein DKP76_06340 [Falsochrobactrum shanghaiense]